jgi:hypothetical protein
MDARLFARARAAAERMAKQPMSEEIHAAHLE